jgi:hypothetical protein
MSRQPIAHNPDLTRLENEGYALDVDVEGYLLVRNVPYVNEKREVKRGTIIGILETRGTLKDIVKFSDHSVYFAGDHPCDDAGRPLVKVVIGSSRQQLGTRIWADHRFSSKPASGTYPSMYAQIKQYVVILESYARRINPVITARTGPVVSTELEDIGPFAYTDTASVRAGIVMVTAKLRYQKVAIVGVGGTGSYVLDLLTKTPVAEIHLFDDDQFLTHNAFRGPGAATLEQLRASLSKVQYWRDLYSSMHTGIFAHPHRIVAENVAELAPFNFVFLCMDSGPDKLAIVTALEEMKTPFIDTGIGVQEVNGALRGTVRTTTSTPTKREHLRQRVSFAPPRDDNDYERNIQVADLNALNATLAIIKWKKLCQFYHDFEHEHDTTYTINSHLLTRDETHDTADANPA